MRILDTVANEKFNGDTHEALKYLFEHSSEYSNDFSEILNSLTMEEAKFSRDFCEPYIINAYSKEKYMSDKKNLNTAISLGFTRDDIRNAKVNPFKAEINKDLFKLLVSNASIVAVSIALEKFGAMDKQSAYITMSSLMEVVNTYFALDIGPDLINYFKFNNLKKKLLADVDDSLDVRKIDSIIKKGGK